MTLEVGIREIPQWLRVHSALAKDTSSVPSNQVGQLKTVYNSSSRGI